MKIDLQKRIGNLELCPVVYLNGKEPDTLEICQWAEDNTHKWTLLTFKYDEQDEIYSVKECCDRLSNPYIDWYVLARLIILGRKYLALVNEVNDEES